MNASADHPTPATVVGQTSHARLTQAEASRVLARVQGMNAEAALAALQFSAGTVCAPIARVVQQAIADARRRFGLAGADLVLAGAEVGEGEVMTRVRRQAHGMADWITTPTTAIRVELRANPSNPNREDA